LAGEEAWEVALDEAKHQHVAKWCQWHDQNDDEWNKGEQITGCSAQCSHLSLFERATKRCLAKQSACEAEHGSSGSSNSSGGGGIAAARNAYQSACDFILCGRLME
jgi:hypothetical protein